ncbi:MULTISPECIES: hypothetical protein [Paenibacillus]|uniref:Uncharacterized protein n=1 Tax=Paenibacillus pabuli TaxID=1472 RepID=A0A855YFI5_9BACL|nr:MULTISPECIES: hypothetical protein [Paenibacillus]PWW45497.1 hypothetical protein DET56_101706 [Paenibacillus pabuli]PXW11834.1 hypothetical protein DEU73_101705 [Paenibacillus taichungensis]RAI84457.1 hypothetical protein DET54_12535 [Paenibacillus pabuli]
MNERAKGKLKKQFVLIILFIFIIGIQLTTNTLVNHSPAWTTALLIFSFLIFCILGLVAYLDLKKQEQLITIGQIVDVRKNKNIIIVKGLGRGNSKILIKDSHILNMMQPNDLIEITRLKYTKMIIKKVYKDEEIQL